MGDICLHKQSKEKIEKIVKDSHSTPSSGKSKPRKLLQAWAKIFQNL